jgi:GNAT superfamily N-acetyltransferase
MMFRIKSSLTKFIWGKKMIKTIIREVLNNKDREIFLRLPYHLYQSDLNWVPPLIADQRQLFNPDKHPFFEHSTAAYFIALQNEKPVGRIAAIKNNNHLSVYFDQTGFFGFFECINDEYVASALFEAAVNWLKQQGLKTMRGPANYSMNEEAGLLVDGFDSPPAIMMTYNPRYYQTLIEKNRFTKKMDLYAYSIDNVHEIPDRLQEAVNLINTGNHFSVRQLNMRRLHTEIDAIKSIYNAAWSENWGAVPLTPREIDKLKHELVQIARPELCFIAEADGRAVGVSITIPDVNEILIKMGGRLFPTGMLKYLWYRRKIKGVRVLIMGVLKEYRNLGIDLLFYYKTFENGLRLGYDHGEMSWILENNIPMRNALEKIPGTRIYKTYRIYEKSIS